jgi:hypothetical protein
MRFAAHPDGAELLRVNLRPRQTVARRFDGHGDRVLVEARHRLLLQR